MKPTVVGRAAAGEICVRSAPCGPHVVLPAGPTGVPLQFTFGSRSSPALLDELGRTLLALAASVPDGIVVFLPSFGYEEQVITP